MRGDPAERRTIPCPSGSLLWLCRQKPGQFYYEGKNYEFNFSKFWTGSRTFFDCRETKDQIIWKVIQTTFRARMAVQISCPKDEMLWINYESPDGRKENVGGEYGVYDK